MSTRAPQIDNNFAISPTSLNTWYLICLVTSWRVWETPFWCNFFNIERKKIIVKPTQWSRGYKMASGQRKGLKGIQRTRRIYFFREYYYWVNWIFHQVPNNISFTQPSTQKRQKKRRKRVIFPASSGDSPTHFFHCCFLWHTFKYIYIFASMFALCANMSLFWWKITLGWLLTMTFVFKSKR